MDLAIFFFGLILIPISLKFFSLPYLWIGFTWAIGFFLLFMRQKKTLFSAVYINLAIITAFLTCSEGYFWKSGASFEKLIGDYWTSNMFQQDMLLGYVPQKNAKEVIGKKYLNNKLVYAMSISTDQYGLRTSYPKANQANDAILFFGCSFTFGIGLNDNETLPYQVGKKLKGQTNVYNFGYGGYGPQQMLSALEQGMVEKIVHEQPIHAFYTTILEHIARSAGLTSWNVNDPKYELDDKGQVYYAGHFNDNVTRLPYWMQQGYAQLNKSYLWQKIQSCLKRQINEKDIEKYIKIVVKAKMEFEKRFPGGKFHVIYWSLQELPNHQIIMNKLFEEFQKNEIPIHLIDNIIPDFQKNQESYLIENDGHPNPKANEYIANYIVTQVLQKG